jgi:uncharacterized sulfatase
MNGIQILIVTVFLLVSFSAQTREKPNIILILADDLGGMDLPVYGNKFNETPNIDQLASQGITFNHAYAAPVCSPTRASIQSGQNTARVGIFDFIPGHWRPYEKVTVPHHAVQYLPTEITTIGEMMKSAGYKTGYFGKWHLGYNEEHLPNNRGYDEAYTYSGGGFYTPHFRPEYKSTGNKRLSQVLTDMGIQFLNENKDAPFFLFISHYDVHVQLDADRDLIDKYLKKEKAPNYPCNAVYAAMIEHVDKSVGDIVSEVKGLGMEENTIIIFFSDNGGVDNRFDNIPLLGGESVNVYPEGHPLQYIATSNVPLRAGKGTLYEGGIRVPLIVKWPGKIPPASKSDAIVSCVDFYPTFAELANTEVKQKLDGESMLDALTGGSGNQEREIFTHYPVYHHEVPMSAVRKGDWKIVQNLVEGEFELFNLKYDVNEMTDLKFSYPEKLAAMKKVLEKWQNNTNAPMPVPNPDFDPVKRYEWGTNPWR